MFSNPENKPVCAWCESVIPPGKSVEEFLGLVNFYRGFGPPSADAATKASDTMKQEPVIGMAKCGRRNPTPAVVTRQCAKCHGVFASEDMFGGRCLECAVQPYAVRGAGRGQCDICGDLFNMSRMYWAPDGDLLCHECAKHGDEKSTNPKDAIGSDKIPLHLWPTTASAMGCLAMLEGALKYGRSNFRASGVRASIYYDACRRHLDAWFEGEESAPDTGTPHLSSALACLAIIVDAQANGKLNDDRMFAETPGYRKLVDELTPHVARLKEQFKDKKPKHYTRESK
jgi:hypothetical protein